MRHFSPLKIRPQKDVLTLKEGQQRVANWKNLMYNFYEKGKDTFPKGVFIPFMDINEIAKLQQEVRTVSTPGTDELQVIYIVGVRGYFTFPLPEEIPINMKAADYPVNLILVPVYQTNERKEGSPEEFEYNDNYDTYDLIAPVAAATKDGTEVIYEASSIYDITQPCPKLCDKESALH